MKIVFIVGSLTDSHIIKRVEAFVEKGFQVEVYGYMRDVSFVNKYKGIEPHVLGVVENERYINRIIPVWKDVTRILHSFTSNTIFYLWGFDIAISALFRNNRYIYEISDVRYASFKKPISALLRLLDRLIIRRSIATVITSEGFVDYLGNNDKFEKKFILLPNKLSRRMLEVGRPHAFGSEENDKIRLGYVGLYRYPNTVVKLAEIVGESFPSMEFHFWGVGDDTIMTKINSIVSRYSNVIEHGPFKNPNDLQRVYSTIDIVACNYDTNGVNERMAEPNKLYESVFFNKPIIVSENTFLSKKVRKLGIGLVINNSKDDMLSFLEKINRDILEEISKREMAIDAKDLVEDYEELWKIIEE